MIDREKLEAIRAEIKRFRKTNKVSEDKEYAQYELDVKCGYDMALDDMLSYINSLSEETVSEDFEKKFISFVNATHDNNGSYSLHDFAQRLYNIAKEELKEPVSDDLEEAAIEICSKVLEGETVVIDGYEYVVLSDAEECFKAGAQWQKEKDESTTEDLGEYINELSKQFPEVSFAKLSRIAVRVAKWHKEQMMAKAVDGYVIEDIEEGNGDFLLSAEYLPKSMGLKDRQKVKVIVIKK